LDSSQIFFPKHSYLSDAHFDSGMGKAELTEDSEGQKTLDDFNVKPEAALPKNPAATSSKYAEQKINNEISVSEKAPVEEQRHGHDSEEKSQPAEKSADLVTVATLTASHVTKKRMLQQVKEIVENPNVVRILDEERPRLFVEDQSVVIPEVCYRLAPFVPGENHINIGAVVKEVWREHLGPKCRNADLYIPKEFKNPNYRGKKALRANSPSQEKRTDQSGVNFASGIVAKPSENVNACSGEVTVRISGIVYSNFAEAQAKPLSEDINSNSVASFSRVSGVVCTTSNWLSGSQGLAVDQGMLSQGINIVGSDTNIGMSVKDIEALSGSTHGNVVTIVSGLTGAATQEPPSLASPEGQSKDFSPGVEGQLSRNVSPVSGSITTSTLALDNNDHISGNALSEMPSQSVAWSPLAGEKLSSDYYATVYGQSSEFRIERQAAAGRLPVVGSGSTSGIFWGILHP